jgi:hypothetical protein
VAFIYAGNDLLSHTLSRAVQSALQGLASVFEMGSAESKTGEISDILWKGVMAMADSDKGPSRGRFETAENAVLLISTAAFFAISIWFLENILTNTQGNLALRIGLAVMSFTFALICFTASPANQGRTLRRLLEKIPPETSTVDDLSKLQLSVGTAGFFNRIGLTGIPLTVALFALVFCALTFLAQNLQQPDLVKAFLDLTKLTVGAFIGSLTKGRTG